MEGKKINKEYIDLIMKNQEKYIDDYHLTLEKVSNSKARYKENQYLLYITPTLLLRRILRISINWDMMISITNKITNRYIEDKEFRKKFGFPKLIEDLIQIDNGYDINVPIGRFDIFYKDYDNFKFCELNTDGSSAMNEDNTIAKILLESKALNDFRKL